MATYMQAPGYVEMLIELNEWDPEVLAAFRASEVVSSIPGGIDSVATLEQLEEISELIPLPLQEALKSAPGHGRTSSTMAQTAWLSTAQHRLNSHRFWMPIEHYDNTTVF